jgi:lactate dehydrogenase-like 2-hydroxyacid dehydrogenase
VRRFAPWGNALPAFEVLIHGPMMPRIVEGLTARLPSHRLWEMADPEGFLSSEGARIGALAGGFTRRIDRSVIDRLPNLRIISNFGVGYDSVDAEYAASRGVVVTNTPDVLSDEVADTAIGLMISAVRKFPQAERHLREGKWLNGAFPLTASLRDRTMGIVGLGRIGKAIARRAEAFGLKLCYHGRSRQADVSLPYYANLLEMAKAVDILMVIVPGGAGTHRMINRAVLEALGPEGFLINVARGSVVDEEALIDCLEKGVIHGAGLDVFEKEPQVPARLLALDNVTLLPHVASASHHTRRLMADLVMDNVFAIASGKPPLTPVPETPWPPRGR